MLVSLVSYFGGRSSKRQRVWAHASIHKIIPLGTSGVVTVNGFVYISIYMPKSPVIAVAGILFVAGREGPWANKFPVDMYATNMCRISKIMGNSFYSISPLNILHCIMTGINKIKYDYRLKSNLKYLEIKSPTE